MGYVTSTAPTNPNLNLNTGFTETGDIMGEGRGIILRTTL